MFNTSANKFQNIRNFKSAIVGNLMNNSEKFQLLGRDGIRTSGHYSKCNQSTPVTDRLNSAQRHQDNPSNVDSIVDDFWTSKLPGKSLVDFYARFNEISFVLTEPQNKILPKIVLSTSKTQIDKHV